ncbi:MAG: protein kinase [Nannocystaceae bacterium]
MDHPTSTAAVTLSRTRIMLPSQVAYDLARLSEPGPARPRVLGAGRFARVYAAQQVIAGLPSRRVAIKILHDHAGYQDERLFSQEVALNREFTMDGTPGVAAMLDVIHLGPLVLCGCGTLYHPRCPSGCGVQLQRVNLRSRPFPALRCTKCDYELSAEYVHQRGHELCGHKAKPCCAQATDPHADDGVIINFALREALVMERLDVSLEDYAVCRDEPIPDRGEPRALTRLPALLGLRRRRERRRKLAAEVRLLSRVHLMVQIAETVAALHREKKVVHKDLAPDNIMVRRAPSWATSSATVFDNEPITALLDEAANLRTEICVIDFGLSDKDKLSRSWYEDAETSLAVTKLPYLSPEARHQRQAIGANLEFDGGQSRFRVPPSLAQSPASIYPQDIISNVYDGQHLQDLVVSKIEGPTSARYAYYEGAPPDAGARLEIVRPIGEAHDVYALGALLYFILTGGDHHEVEQLSHLVASIQDQPCRMNRESLARRNNYANRLRSMREPFWRDELLLVSIRAMVRGRPESFARDRTVRGAGPAVAFLTELKRVQHGINADIFPTKHAPLDAQRCQRTLMLIALFGVVLMTAWVQSCVVCVGGICTGDV